MSDWGRLISAPTWIDLGRSSKESLSVADFNHFIVCNLAIGATGDYFEQVPIRADWRFRHVTELKAGHVSLRDRIVHSVDLDVKFVRLRVVAFCWLFRFVAHVRSSGDVMVSSYHNTKILDNIGGLVVISEI
jgi:hypothetical protein